MMNLPCKVQEVVGARGGDGLAAFLGPENMVAPFEFRLLAGDEIESMEWARVASLNARQTEGARGQEGAGKGGGGDMGLDAIGFAAGGGHVRAAEKLRAEASLAAARQEGLQAGEREGRRTGRAEVEGEMQAGVARERARLLGVVEEFGGQRERYFTGVEQEVVKLALAIAARVLHREAQMDPLLLAAAVRVALDKMADRSGVVLRSAEGDVEAWEQVFLATEPNQRPRVVGDALLGLGECVLETKMGTVELGVSAQLEEIEKGFFDLLNHRPEMANSGAELAGHGSPR